MATILFLCSGLKDINRFHDIRNVTALNKISDLQDDKTVRQQDIKNSVPL